MRIYKAGRLLTAAVIMLYFIMSSGYGIAEAFSASIWFEADSETIREGDLFQVSLCISSDTTLGGFDGLLSYQNDQIAYVEGPECISLEDGLLHIYDPNASASWEDRQYIMTFRALKPGFGLIQLVHDIKAYDYETGEAMTVSALVCQLVIEPAEEIVSDARLSMLKIEPGILTPSFSSDVFEYSTFIDPGTEKLIVGAEPIDPLSNVKVTGNTPLADGENTIRIIVTSPSGEELVYTISAIREEAETAPVVTPEAEKTIEAEWRFEVTQDETDAYINGQYVYKIREKTADITIPEGYRRTKMRLNKIPITVYAKEGEETPRFYLLVLENETGEIALYQYDRAEKTVQRYTGSGQGEEPDSGKMEEMTVLQDAETLLSYKNKLSSLSLITGFCGAVSVLLAVLSVSLLVKLIRKRRQEEDDMY